MSGIAYGRKSRKLSIIFTVDPMTGKQRPVPYGMGIIRLDGAATGIFHFVDEIDETKLRVGRRVKANIRPEREGNQQDIISFRLVDWRHE